MRLYCKHCQMSLLIKHTIEIELSSEFDYKPDMLTLTNHHINQSKNINAFIETEKVKDFYCMECGNESNLETAMFRCDDCGGLFDSSTSQQIGESLIICNGCLNGNKTLDFFKIFGKRGPSKKTRDDRVVEAMGEARIEVPAEQLLEELDRFNMENAQANVPAPPINIEDVFEGEGVAGPPVEMGNVNIDQDNLDMNRERELRDAVLRDAELEIDQLGRERRDRDDRILANIRAEEGEQRG